MPARAQPDGWESPRAEWHRVSRYVSRRGAATVARELVAAIRDNDLLTYASAISYQIVYAIIPTALAVLALLGFLQLGDIWSEQVAPLARERLSAEAFALLDRAATRILGSGQVFWLTAGAAIALWQVSGAVRATMGALNRVYRVEEGRALGRRLAISLGLAALVSTAVTLALLLFHLGPRLLKITGLPEALGSVARWLPAALLLLVAVTALARYAPARRQPAPWMGLVALAIVASWLLASLLFGLYVLRVGTYTSVYGSLAAVILVLTYVYLSVVVFLAGLQLDALVRGGGPRAGER
ncbi:MAG: YihY/virulence factor BrkB family protein [Thermoleophilia bacterium]|nr:YihY/virulence factor BrkB family protein [Thermoleophilia bacterium]